MSREDPQMKIRLPADLKDQIEAAAKAAGRSMNAEIVARLENALVSQPAVSDVQLMVNMYLATLENQAAMTEMRIQMAGMKLDSLHQRAYQLVLSSQKDVTKMSAKELEVAEQEIEAMRNVEREIDQLGKELDDLKKNRERVLKSIKEVRSAVKSKVQELEEALATRKLKG